MPRRPKTKPETKPAAATESEAKLAEPGVKPPRGTKTAAIKAALIAHPTKMPKEIAPLLQSEGWDVTPQQISVVKSNMKAEGQTAAPAPRRTPAPAAKRTPAPAPRATGDNDLSFDTLRRAKELSKQLGGVEEAKKTLDALAQLIG